ncbi:MAG: DUF2802 domain-containing protein [Bdellovibrionaceae bacterium]|nr:DUF2802 domain-containing protein [Pseudobdellovibrionaceae bacterium]
MSLWIIVQLVFNIFVALVVYVFWVKLRRPPKDDPRLSRGLQLLQSKISVLEDLSDKTELQVEQLNSFMEKKIKQVQNKLEEADTKLRQIESHIQRNKEVAKIFQNNIPHDEIVKRQNTIKYIKAAKMANTGSSVEEICQVVDLPQSEIELIAKLNKDNLVFDDDGLPEWAREESESYGNDEWKIKEENFVHGDIGQTLNFEAKKYESLQKLGEEFRKACTDFEMNSKEEEKPSQIMEAAKIVKEKVADLSGELAGTVVSKVQKSLNKLNDSFEFQNSSGGENESIEIVEVTTPSPELILAKKPTVSPETHQKPSFSYAEVLETDSTVSALSKMQQNRRLELSKPESQEIKKVQFPKLNMDINKTLR